MTVIRPPRRRGVGVPSRRVDFALAGGVVLLSFCSLVVKHAGTGERPYDPAAWFLTALAATAVVLRRRRPMFMLAMTLAVVVVWFSRHYSPGTIVFAVFVALLTVAETGDRRRSALVGMAVAGVGTVAFALVQHHRPDTVALLAGFGWIGASLFAGDAIRSRRAYVAAVEQRARDAERAREEEARRRVDEERLRIARELHDVVAHSIATINVQSGVAAHVMHKQPEKAYAALIAIKEASREALRELRATLNVLRESDDAVPSLAPAPGLGQLALLIETTQRAGLPIELIGDPAAIIVPPTVGLTAYRIVQEALTNVLRHAPAARAVICLEVLGDRLTIDVIDDGCSTSVHPEPFGGGHGLIGMRERVRAVGGDLETGSVPEGGFRVHAELPIVASRV